MTSPSDRFKGFATEAIRAANVQDRSAVPIFMGATNLGQYTRDQNPTLAVLEKALTRLDRGEGAVVGGSGMAAITQTLWTLLHQGGRVIRHRCMYVSAAQFFEEVLPNYGVEVVTLDLRDPAELEKALASPAQVVYTESIVNPTLEVVDIQAVAEATHKAGAVLVVDNTFASPYFCRPLELGADVALYSATKFLSGHGDALGGAAVCRRKELAERIRHMMTIHGGVLSPFNASLILRSLKTLALRMEGHAANAAKLAAFLASHPKVAYVRYPGLSDDSEHATAAKQMSGFGGMVGFGIAAGQGAAEAFGRHLSLAKAWPSLGDVQTLVTVTREWPPAAIPAAYARVSVGLEDIEDIIADFDQALGAI